MNRTLWIKLLSSCWLVCVLGSEEEQIPVHIFGRNVEGMLYQSCFLQCSLRSTVCALQEKWVAMRTEEDSDYKDYGIKVFVKLPVKKAGKMSDYEEKRIDRPKSSKVNASWRKVKEKDPYVSFIFEEEERKAKIKIYDEVGAQKIVHDKVYGFRTKISQIKDDILLERTSKELNASHLTRDQVVINYYFMYTNKTFTISDSFTLGQFLRYFYKDSQPSKFAFHLKIAPVTNDKSPPFVEDTQQTVDTTSDEEDFLHEDTSNDSSSSKAPGALLGSIGVVGGLLYRKSSKAKDTKKKEEDTILEGD